MNQAFLRNLFQEGFFLFIMGKDYFIQPHRAALRVTLRAALRVTLRAALRGSLGPHCESRWGPQSGAIAACFLGFVQACICLLNELVHGKGILVLLVAQAHAYCYMV